MPNKSPKMVPMSTGITMLIGGIAFIILGLIVSEFLMLLGIILIGAVLFIALVQGRRLRKKEDMSNRHNQDISD